MESGEIGELYIFCWINFGVLLGEIISFFGKKIVYGMIFLLQKKITIFLILFRLPFSLLTWFSFISTS